MGEAGILDIFSIITTTLFFIFKIRKLNLSQTDDDILVYIKDISSNLVSLFYTTVWLTTHYMDVIGF